MKNSEEIRYLFYLTRIKNLGNVRIKNLILVTKSPKLCFELSLKELVQVDGINDKIASEIIKSRKLFSGYETQFQEILKKAEKKKIEITTLYDNDYPENLKNIYDAPVILYYIGKLTDADKYSISVIGTRFPSEYGKKVCNKLVDEISKYKIPIISGFARGIDSIAHLTAVLNKNVTYAVLGSGVDIIYPKENKKLFEEIIENGAVFSEFDIGAGPDKINFPRRNRIISGISLGTIIVETGLKGGSLITAGFALDQGREVFAIPGFIYSKKSEGSNELIKKGQAKLVTKVEDILNEIQYQIQPLLKPQSDSSKKSIEKQLNIFEKKLYDNIDFEPIHIDKLSEISGLSISECLVNLLSLELKGYIKQIPGKYFLKI